MWVRRAPAIAWMVVVGGSTACGSAKEPEGTGGAGPVGASAPSNAGAGAASQGGGGHGEADAGCAKEVDGGSPLDDAGAPVCNGAGARFVTRVVSACFGPGQNFGQGALPGIVEGPPKGGGCCAGSLDVCSLGDGGSITVAFDGNAIVDGPGPDFIVFENPFAVGGDPTNVNAELATVEVSPDGARWSAFPCTASAYPYGSCAGWHPVYANPDQNTIDPLDPNVAGGDAFDLADIGISMARWVRITDRPDLPTVFDLDAVAIVNASCP